MPRYQPIIDVLADSGCFETIYFDHETELPVSYRGIGFLKRNALQERPGKGRDLHKKWADICAIRKGMVRIIIEEERKATHEKVRTDISIISKCKYLWADDTLFHIDPDCALFILLNDNVYDVRERIMHDVGNLKTVVVCKKESFLLNYERYGMLREH